jgi:hypothetical protein
VQFSAPRSKEKDGGWSLGLEQLNGGIKGCYSAVARPKVSTRQEGS